MRNAVHRHLAVDSGASASGGTAGPKKTTGLPGGGLLACVPADMAPSLLAQLRQTDPDAALIGQVTDGPAAITTTP